MVERTNSWLSNYGQLRRNTDRKPAHLTCAVLAGCSVHHYREAVRTRQVAEQALLGDAGLSFRFLVGVQGKLQPAPIRPLRKSSAWCCKKLNLYGSSCGPDTVLSRLFCQKAAPYCRGLLVDSAPKASPLERTQQLSTGPYHCIYLTTMHYQHHSIDFG